MGFGKKVVPYRFLATRELLEEQPLHGLEDQQRLPFQTMAWASQSYKVFGLVTNRRVEEGWTAPKVAGHCRGVLCYVPVVVDHGTACGQPRPATWWWAGRQAPEAGDE